jgi:hypothetical protein
MIEFAADEFACCLLAAFTGGLLLGIWIYGGFV